MKYKNASEESKKLGIGNTNYQLQVGENKFRALTEPEPYIQHFIKADNRYVNCGGEKCTYCANKIKRDSKVMLYILDRKDEEVKLAKLPWAFYIGMGDLAASTDWGFDSLPDYDVNMNKKGQGMETRYKVDPTPNKKPLTKDQLEKLKSMKPISEVLAKWKSKNDRPEDSMPSSSDSDIDTSDLPF